MPTQNKKKLALALKLCILAPPLWIFNRHLLYVGKIGPDILHFLALGVCYLWSFTDLMVIAFGKFKDKNGDLLHMEAVDPSTKSKKNFLTTLILCIYLGPFGGHRFYVGKIGTGLLQLLTLGGLGIWTMLDLILILGARFKDKDGRHLRIDLIPSDAAAKSEKNLLTAFKLCLFLSVLGAHRFYVGKIGTGLLQFLTLGGLGIWILSEQMPLNHLVR